MTGALDTNGIYIYDEDDIQPTFSDLLNLLAQSASDSVAAHYASLAARLALLEDDSGWVTNGFTPAGGVTITGASIKRRFGDVISISAFGALDTISVPTSGDVSNTPLFTVPSGFAPAVQQGLTARGTGRANGYDITGNTVRLNAVSPDATQTTTQTVTNLPWSVGGLYFLH